MRTTHTRDGLRLLSYHCAVTCLFLLLFSTLLHAQTRNWHWEWDQLDLSLAEGDTLLQAGGKPVQLFNEDFPRFIQRQADSTLRMVYNAAPNGEAPVWTYDDEFCNGMRPAPNWWNASIEDSCLCMQIYTIVETPELGIKLVFKKRNLLNNDSEWVTDSTASTFIPRDELGSLYYMSICYFNNDDFQGWILVSDNITCYRVAWEDNQWNIDHYCIIDDYAYDYYPIGRNAMIADVNDDDELDVLIFYERWADGMRGPYFVCSSVLLLESIFEEHCDTLICENCQYVQGSFACVDLYHDGTNEIVGGSELGFVTFELLDEAPLLQPVQLWNEPSCLAGLWCDDASGELSSFVLSGGTYTQWSTEDAEQYYTNTGCIDIQDVNTLQSTWIDTGEAKRQSLLVREIYGEYNAAVTTVETWSKLSNMCWECLEGSHRSDSYSDNYCEYTLGDWSGDDMPDLIYYGEYFDGDYTYFTGSVYSRDSTGYNHVVGWEPRDHHFRGDLVNIDRYGGPDLLGYDGNDAPRLCLNLSDYGEIPEWGRVVYPFPHVELPDPPDFKFYVDWQADGDTDILYPDGRILVNETTVSVDDEPGTSVHPSDFGILSTYPNPFNATLQVSFSTAGQPGIVRVYDVLGREVLEPMHVNSQIGDGSLNLQTNGLASGVYFLSLEAGALHAVQRVVLLK